MADPGNTKIWKYQNLKNTRFGILNSKKKNFLPLLYSAMKAMNKNNMLKTENEKTRREWEEGTKGWKTERKLKLFGESAPGRKSF